MFKRIRALKHLILSIWFWYCRYGGYYECWKSWPTASAEQETPVRPIPGSNSAKAPSSKRQFTYDPDIDTYLNVNAPSKKSKKSDKEPSLSDQVLMAQLTWLQLKTARMQKETADKGVQFDGALDLFDC